MRMELKTLFSPKKIGDVQIKNLKTNKEYRVDGTWLLGGIIKRK